MFICQLAFSSLGFMFGAILYRVDIKTNIVLFIVLPIIAALYIIRLSYINADLINRIGESILWIFNYFIQNPSVFYIIEVLVAIIGLGISYLVFKNAPIKEYAHNILRIKI